MFEECRKEGDFETSSGKKSPYFYDFDLLSSKDTMEYAAKLVELIPRSLQSAIDFVATPILGGIEIAFVVAGALHVPRVKVLTVEGRTRGPVFGGKKFLIVDDVISSGQAVNKVIKLLPKDTCVGAAAFIFRGQEGSMCKAFPLFYLERKELEV
jgi:orotate phosphoribosyltransferase